MRKGTHRAGIRNSITLKTGVHTIWVIQITDPADPKQHPFETIRLLELSSLAKANAAGKTIADGNVQRTYSGIAT
jgi:hypothetical protein